MVEEVKADIVDREMPDAGHDFLQLHLFAGDGDQAFHFAFASYLPMRRANTVIVNDARCIVDTPFATTRSTHFPTARP